MYGSKYLGHVSLCMGRTWGRSRLLLMMNNEARDCRKGGRKRVLFALSCCKKVVLNFTSDKLCKSLSNLKNYFFFSGLKATLLEVSSLTP